MDDNRIEYLTKRNKRSIANDNIIWYFLKKISNICLLVTLHSAIASDFFMELVSPDIHSIYMFRSLLKEYLGKTACRTPNIETIHSLYCYFLMMREETMKLHGTSRDPVYSLIFCEGYRISFRDILRYFCARIPINKNQSSFDKLFGSISGYIMMHGKITIKTHISLYSTNHGYSFQLLDKSLFQETGFLYPEILTTPSHSHYRLDFVQYRFLDEQTRWYRAFL